MRTIIETIEHEDKERELELLTPSELVATWASSIEGDIERPLTTCIPKFDKVLRNKLRGTVGAYIGKGGTKKSLLALQACKVNVQAHKNNCTGIYSNMEMAIFQFLSRIIDMSLTVQDYSYNTSWYFESEYKKAFLTHDKKEMEKLRRVLSGYLNDLYGNNLYINSQSGMTIDDFHKLVKKAKGKNKVVDMLVIDGLSMMSGKGTETETYTTNSKELKDLAKLHNIYIPLICHVTKAATKHTRDLQEFIRGSEKILDNVDFQIMTSLCIDESRSSGEVTEYLEDKGYVRLYDKRGSGKTVNVIYQFDQTTLEIIETELDPVLYEVKKESKKAW
jgi:predicted ATP-dependent serine protease